MIVLPPFVAPHLTLARIGAPLDFSVEDHRIYQAILKGRLDVTYELSSRTGVFVEGSINDRDYK